MHAARRLGAVAVPDDAAELSIWDEYEGVPSLVLEYGTKQLAKTMEQDWWRRDM